MNFTNCQVTIHAINNYTTVTVSDPSSNTTFDLSASNAYSPYYTYTGTNSGCNVCCFAPMDLSGGRVSLSPPGEMKNTICYAGMPVMTSNISKGSRPIYSYFS